jgi:hypothetical protein
MQRRRFTSNSNSTGQPHVPSPGMPGEGSGEGLSVKKPCFQATFQTALSHEYEGEGVKPEHAIALSNLQTPNSKLQTPNSKLQTIFPHAFFAANGMMCENSSVAGAGMDAP